MSGTYKGWMNWFGVWVILIRYVGKWIEAFEGVYGGNGNEKRNSKGRRLLDVWDEKVLGLVSTEFRKAEERQVNFSASEKETDLFRLG